jgi:pSer/pThr/pTyr-binding forkhead associated (FHA) protein
VSNLPGSSETPESPKAWLVSRPGATVRICYEIHTDPARIGRAPDNDLVIQGPDSGTVSLHHAVIERSVIDGRAEFRVRDLESTNGTFLDGTRITESTLEPEASIRLGTQGPELSLALQEPAEADLDRTAVIPEPVISSPPTGSYPRGSYHSLLTEGVKRAREARANGLAGQTMTIMRETLDRALNHSSRRFHVLTAVMTTGLIAVSGYAAWQIFHLNQEKHAIDGHIADLEGQLQKVRSSDQADRLVDEINNYAEAGKEVQDTFLYRIGHHEHDFVTDEIRGLMAEFGAETYSIPPEFTARVKYHIEQYQGPNRPVIARALGSAAGKIASMRAVLDEQHLPPDLAYVPLVESALEPGRSRAGAAGLWQLTPVTAKAFGLRVNSEVDERINVMKSTRAACQYLRELILDFGSGSSVMLALAAYNVGPGKVKQAINKVPDPIKQRNFWYLYRVRALPLETREYVPKVVAAMIIGRNPQRFGF